MQCEGCESVMVVLPTLAWLASARTACTLKAAGQPTRARLVQGRVNHTHAFGSADGLDASMRASPARQSSI